MYYKPVSQTAPNYKVNPALVLGMGIEGAFADPNIKNSTYNTTGDVFGQTGGNTKNMTTAKDPTQNANGWFANWGQQVQGVGSNVPAFLNGLEGMNAEGQRVKGWKVYNSVKGGAPWRIMAASGIRQMLMEIPIYLKKCLH